MNSKSDHITSLRNQIDELDKELAQNILKRQALSYQVAKLKKELNLANEDKNRENEILNTLSQYCKTETEKTLIKSIFNFFTFVKLSFFNRFWTSFNISYD